MPVRDILLPKHAGRVDVASYPTETECYWLCLTNQEMHVCRAFLFPYARWDTRLVQMIRPGHGHVDADVVRTMDDSTFAAYLEVVDSLDLKLGGCSMSCTELSEQLASIAAAITAGGGGGGCTVTVTCPTGSTVLGTALAGVPDDQYTGIPAQTPPEEGVPPDGFETWAEYKSYKCRTAQLVWLALDRWLIALDAFLGLQVTATLAAPLIASAVGGAFLVLTPVGWAVVIGAILEMSIMYLAGVDIIGQVRAYLTAHKDEIVCALYNSGDAATAIAGINGVVEDAIQDIEWGAILTPFAGPLGVALGVAIGAVDPNSLVNPLFKLVLDVALPDATCPCEDSSQDEWHFDANAQYWAWWDAPGNDVFGTPSWEAAPDPVDPSDSSAGCLQAIIDLPSGSYAFYDAAFRLPGSELAAATAHTGDQLSADVYNDSSAYNCEIGIKIHYSDDSEDQVFTHDKDAWNRIYLSVTAGNDGKTIEYLMLAVSPNDGDRDPVNYRFDKVTWVPA